MRKPSRWILIYFEQLALNFFLDAQINIINCVVSIELYIFINMAKIQEVWNCVFRCFKGWYYSLHVDRDIVIGSRETVIADCA